MLKIINLSKSFGNNVVLKDFSYHFRSHTIYALMGANGSGKTTLFHLLGGFLRGDAGQILFKERDIMTLPPHIIANMGLSRTFQDMRLIPTLSVYDNLLLALNNKKTEPLYYAFLPSKKANYPQIEAILHQTHLWDIRESKASEISYGQQKLLNLAIAMVDDFDVLLLDEPVAGVQPEYRAQILSLIKGLNKTVIVVEHNPEFLEALTDKILFLDGGLIIAEGDYASIKADKRVEEAYL